MTKPRSLVLTLLFAGVLVCGLTGCGREANLPAMQEEANGLVKDYAARFEWLARRADALNARGNALGVTRPDAAAAGQMFSSAVQELKSLRETAASAPAQINAAAANGKQAELQRLLDSLDIQFGNGWTVVNAKLDAVESWIVNAERLGAAPPPTEPVPTTPPGPSTPPTTTGAPLGTGPESGTPTPAPPR